MIVVAALAIILRRGRGGRMSLQKANLGLFPGGLLIIICGSPLLYLILSGSHMQFGDYFRMVGQLYDDGGHVNAAGLFLHANEHLVAIPKLLYLLNIILAAGSNITLGLAVWWFAAAIALLVLSAASESLRGGYLQKLIVAFAIGLFSFPIAAVHNFVFAMSGASWILANLFAVASLFL